MLGETDVRDDAGNIIISPGLKVRHKASQYEYTVDNVIEDPNGDIQIILRMPDEPRFDPPPEDPEVIQDIRMYERILYEVDPDGLYIVDPGDGDLDPSQPPLEDDELLAVNQDEFESDYEVK